MISTNFSFHLQAPQRCGPCTNAGRRESLQGHGITPEMLRDLCLGAVKLLMDDWRRINKALDKLEAEERKAAQNA